MQTVKDAVNYVGDKASELTNTASKEANKEVAKDDSASMGTRATAAKDAVGDKINEVKDGASATANKEKAKH
ncbi:glucose-repressible protein Grg1 [Melampsora americana]|nr:glucose-repressible protein Grg1 [Melampsora americana]